MENGEARSGLADPEQHAVIVPASVEGSAVKEAVVSLDEAVDGVVAVQELPAAILSEGEEFGELPGRRQFEQGAALWVGDALVGDLGPPIEIAVGGLDDGIRARALGALVVVAASKASESEKLVDGSGLGVGAGRHQQSQQKTESKFEGAISLGDRVLPDTHPPSNMLNCTFGEHFAAESELHLLLLFH